MMRTIMIQQHSFIIDDYVYSAWHQRPEFAHSAAWHTQSRHENPLCSGNIRDSGLGFIPAPSSPSVGRQETCSLSHASYHRRLDKRSAYSDLHHHNFFPQGACVMSRILHGGSNLGLATKIYGLQLRDAILGERYAHINFGDDGVHVVLTTVATFLVPSLLTF